MTNKEFTGIVGVILKDPPFKFTTVSFSHTYLSINEEDIFVSLSYKC